MAAVKIMLVEDEVIVARDLQGRLEDLGYEVPAAVSSGEEAVGKAGETRPDVILMDIFLEGEMDGVEVAEQIRTRFDIPVIYLTAHSDEQTLERAKVTEPYGYILKPVEDRELYSAVEMALYRHSMERRLREYSEHLEEMVEERTRELQDAQEKLVRREKLAVLGQLAGGVGHELRNPLAVISNAIYFLNLTLPDPDETTREYLEMISSEIRNAEKIVSDLLDFSRVESVEREETEVSELVAGVSVKHPPPEGVEVSTEVPSDLPSAFVDGRQMGQVLSNLLLNAYQAMPEGGCVRIAADEIDVDDTIRIRISDTGCGISSEDLERIFEPLFTTKARGIGLGLSVSRDLLEVNGGSIEVESEEGRGSTFTVRLPADTDCTDSVED